MSREPREVGILFADIAGSMRLYEAFGDTRALAIIEACLTVVATAVGRYRGAVVKTIGDEIMATFPSLIETWSAALEVQGEIDRLPDLQAASGRIKLAVRVGFDFGQAIESRGDFFGGTANMAARMAQLAKRGQIIATRDCEALLPAGHKFRTRSLDRVAVKGQPDGVQVVEVIWKAQADARDMTVIDLPLVQGPARPACRLRLRLGFREWLFDGDNPRVSVGREPANDVVVTSSSASRNHATIERRRDRWVVVDHSSNGTFVVPSGQAGIHLRHEELILGQAGTIGFGYPDPSDASEGLSFAVI